MTWRGNEPGAGYKWIALSNTTLGVLMASLNSSSILVALPVVFRGIQLDPLGKGNFGYLLWILMVYMLIQAVFVITFGRIGDIFGRVRMYNLGFVVFTAGSVLLSVTWSTGSAGAIELIAFRVVQAIGGAMLSANSVAILTDAFPSRQRGLAIGVNQVAALVGSFAGLLLGGLLAALNWRWVFLANVPVGVVGTVWSYLMLREIGERRPARIDWIGNITLAAGLTMLLVGVNYGIQPSATSRMSWTTPFVLSMLIGGLVVLCLFIAAERHVSAPLFRLSLFRVRSFVAGNVASLLAAIGRGGLQFMLIIWLQGIWLPLHGFDFEDTPLWAGIYMLPMTLGFLVSGPLSGRLSDTYGPRWFTTIGLALGAVSFVLLIALPVDFPYLVFAAILFFYGVSSGLFASPNAAAVMNSVPPESRGVAAGMRSAFFNVGSPLSIGIFFSLMIVGLNSTVPAAIFKGLTLNGVPTAIATPVSQVPPVSYLFAAFLGFNPFESLLGQRVLSRLPATTATTLTSRSFFPQLIGDSFKHGLSIVLVFSIVIYIVAVSVSWSRGEKYVHGEVRTRTGAS